MGDLGSIPELGRSPGAGQGNQLPVFFPGEFHGQRSLAGGPGLVAMGVTVSDMTEQRSIHQIHRKSKYSKMLMCAESRKWVYQHSLDCFLNFSVYL